MLLIECEVQLQNIHSRVAKHPEVAPISVLLNELANFVFAQSPSFSYARKLELGIISNTGTTKVAQRSRSTRVIIWRIMRTCWRRSGTRGSSARC